MTVTYFGIPLPTSTRALPQGEHTIRYTKFPTSSLNWQGSDWESPTALTFTTATADAVRLGFAAMLPDDPEGFVYTARRALEHGIRDARRTLQQTDRVIDTAGLHVSAADSPHGTQLRMEGKAWPSIPGVTIPAEDTTL